MVFKIGDECVLHAFRWVSLEELKTKVALVDKRCCGLVRTFFRRYLDQETAVRDLPGRAAVFGLGYEPFLNRMKSLHSLEIWEVAFKSNRFLLAKILSPPYDSPWAARLEHLSISSPDGLFGDGQMTAIVNKFPNLRGISLRNARSLTDQAVSQLAGLLKLREIAFSDCAGVSVVSATKLAAAPRLTSVTIHDSFFGEPSVVSALLDAPKLTRLELSQNFLDISHDLCPETIAQKGQNLTHLSVSHSPNSEAVDAAVLDAFRDVACKCHKLVCIDFTGCRFLTYADRVENLGYFEQRIRAASLNAGFKVIGLDNGFIIQLHQKLFNRTFSFLKRRDIARVAQTCRALHSVERAYIDFLYDS